jgi:colanic acid biosynthesis glycosyl transferase WcaI
VRIIINDYLGHAPQVQLSRALASRGHDVLHLYSADVQTPKADLRRRPDDPPNFAIEGLTLGSPLASSFFGRRLQESKFGRIVAWRAMAFRPDVLVACNNPLDVQSNVQSACRRARIPFVYWMQEFYSVKIDQMIEGRGAIFNIAVGSYYHWLERRLLQRSDAVVPIAEDLLGILAESWDVYDRQCMVVRNWSPLDRLTPGEKNNEWSRSIGISDKKVALYTGSLGSMEGPLLLVQLAEKLRERLDVVILVVSEGAGAERVALEAKSRALENLRVLPFQPYEIYGDVLASADVLLALVNAQAGVLSVPSKVTSYLCAGRPIVLSAPWQNLAGTTIQESGGGRVVPPGDAAALADAVLAFLNDDDLRKEAGALARSYAERTFEISTITDRFERLFERLHSGTPRRR